MPDGCPTCPTYCCPESAIDLAPAFDRTCRIFVCPCHDQQGSGDLPHLRFSHCRFAFWSSPRRLSKFLERRRSKVGSRDCSYVSGGCHLCAYDVSSDFGIFNKRPRKCWSIDPIHQWR